MATRKLIVEVVGDASGLSRTFRGASADAQSLGGSLGRLSIGLGQLVKGFVFIEVLQKAFQGLDDAVHIGIGGFTDTTRVAAQTAAVIKSTGDASNLSAKQVHALAASLSNVSGIDDEVIQSAENVLLSFTQIRDFAGKNNDIFTRATKVVTDYESRTGKAASTSATIIGRALADPATKAVALSRAGIVLTKSQLDALKAIEKTSGVVAAQKVLLSDLESRYQGAAAAAGKTLPGQLDILRERFKDFAGELVGDVVPAFSGALKGLTAFVVKLTETKGAHAKFDVVVDGLKDLGSKIEGEFDKIDFRGIASRLAGRAGAALKAVNWKAAIEEAGRAAGDALSATFNKLADVLDRVNFNEVGRSIVRDLGKAIGAVVVFLKSVNWDAVAKATFRLLVAAFKAQVNLMAGIGEAVGKALVDGIGRGLDSVGSALEAKAIKVVLGIIDPFTSIPSILGPEGGMARDLKTKLHATLDSLNAPSAADGATVGATFVAGIIGAVNQAQGALAAALKSGIAVSQAAGAGSRNTSGTTSDATPNPALPPAPAAPRAAGLSATQRNSFFDSAISSDLTRAGFITNIKSQIGALQTIAGLISARLAATKDVTRRRTLEDQLLSVQSQIKGDQAQVASDFLASLQFGITKAQATATFRDDVAAFTALENGIKAEIKATGDTLDLQQQLFDAVQGLKAAKSSQLSAKDFKILGFGPTGDDITPGLKRLRTEYANVVKEISGTSLDTSKVRTELAAIKKVISDSLVPPDVRTKMQQLLADLEGQLTKAGNQLGFKQLDTSAFADSLGLTGDAKRRAEAKLSQIGKGGTVPNTGVGAFGVGVPTGSSAGGRGLTITPSTVVVKIDQSEIGRASMTWKISHDRRNPSQRRGPNAGN